MGGTLKILPIPPGLVCLVWSQAKPLLDRAIAEAEGDLDEVKLRQRLEDGNEILVTVVDQDEIIAVVVITTLTLDTGRKVLFIAATAGTRMDEWLEPDGMAFLRALAAEQGCDGIRACGRPGWARALPNARALHQIIEFH